MVAIFLHLGLFRLDGSGTRPGFRSLADREKTEKQMGSSKIFPS